MGAFLEQIAVSSPLASSAAHALPARSCTATPIGAAAGAHPAAGRQVDVASRLHPRPAERRARPRVAGLLEGDDVLRTAEACRALGATIERDGPGPWASSKASASGTCANPTAPLDFGNAGTGTRLMMGVVGGGGVTATFDGDASLRKRPMRRILDPLEQHGRRVFCAKRRAAAARSSCKAPRSRARSATARRSPRPRSSRPCCSPGSMRPGATIVIETEASRDHTEKMLRHFGAEVRRRALWAGRPQDHADRPAAACAPRRSSVPADPSSAAFAIVAALIVPGSDVIIEGVMMNPLRTG